MKLASLAKSSTIYFVGNLMRHLVGFVMIPVYTRYLTTADYGVIELMERMVTVSALVIGLEAVGGAMIRIYHDKKDEEWQKSVVSTTLLGGGGVALVLSLVGLFFAKPLAWMLFGAAADTELLQVIFITIFTSHLVAVCMNYLRVKDRPGLFVLVSTGQLVIALSLNIWLIAFQGYGIWGFGISRLASSGAGAVFLIAITVREVGVRWNPEAVRRMVRFGSPLILAGIAMFVSHFVDRFFLNHYASLGDVGIYSLGYKFGFLITYFVGGPFHRAWNALMYAHTDEEGWRDKFGQVLSYFVFALLFAWTGLCLLIGDTLRILSAPAFHGAAVFVPLIAMGYVGRSLGDFFRTILYIDKRSGLATKVVVSCALFNLGLNWALIPAFGAWGAAWATLSTWFAYMIVMWLLAQRHHRLPVAYRNVLVLAGLAAICYVASTLVRDWTAIARWSATAVLIVAFPAAAWVAGYFTASQKQALRRALLARRRRRSADSQQP